MADEVSTTLKPIPVSPNTYAPLAAVAVSVGMPLAPSASLSGEVVLGKADAAGTTYCVGLASSPAPAGDRPHCQFAGPLTLTVAEWAALTGEAGGLTRNVPYYLSSATAGHLTKTKPSSGGTFVAPVGVATSETTLMILIQFPSLNS